MRRFGLFRTSLIALMITSLTFALSVQEILEKNLDFSIDMSNDLAAEGAKAANAAQNLAVANAGLQGVLNALNQELPGLQQRITIAQQQGDQHTVNILEAKQQILNDLKLDLVAASTADAEFTSEMQDLANAVVGQANAATTFGNCVRDQLGLPNLPLATSYFFVPPPVPSIPPPSSGDLGTYVEENQDLIDAADAAIGDQKPPKEGEMPDKVDAFNAASKTIGDIKKAHEKAFDKAIKEGEALVKEIKKLGDPVDPRLAAKAACLLTLLNSLAGFNTNDAEAARALDKTAIERAHEGVKQAIEDMDIVRRSV